MSDWRSRGACRDMGDDTFFPAPGNTPATNYAKAICAACPVRRACLEDALEAEGGRTKAYRFGVRGGKSSGQRYAIYSSRRKQSQRAAV